MSTKTKIFLQKVGNFFTTNIKIALVISLFGGVPGIINIWNWTHEKPKFFFYSASITNGQFLQRPQNGPPFHVQFILLSGALYNNGSKPLFPTNFELFLSYNDGRPDLRLASAPLPDSQFRASLGIPFKVDSGAQRDLLRIFRVNPSDANYGVLFFGVKSESVIFGYNKVKISCIDITGKKYFCNLDLERNVQLIEPFRDVKTGTSIEQY